MPTLLNYQKLHGEAIERHLNELIPPPHGPYQDLFKAARYSLLSGGKRLRPLIVLATVEAFGKDITIALRAACTLEFIHTYSLIHDDLPCMDNDDFRRGMPTLHKQFNEGHALLTGDYLLTYAFEVLATDPLLSPYKKIELIKALSRRSGSDGMIGGQVRDISLDAPTSLEQLHMLHKSKTAALIIAAVEFGGIIADADIEHMHRLREYGENIGMAFQIIDDILDVTDSETKHGRAIASDVINHKTTYVSLLGLEGAYHAAQQYHLQALHAIEALPIYRETLVNLSSYIVDR